MKRRPLSPWFTAVVSLAFVACASGGKGGGGEKTAAAKKAQGCDNFAHPCSAEEACIDGSCRPKACQNDGDCGANGYCSPSAGICGVNGFYCHTAADTCVDPTLDCGSSCMQSCTYFPDQQRFACSSFVCGGC